MANRSGGAYSNHHLVPVFRSCIKHLKKKNFAFGFLFIPCFLIRDKASLISIRQLTFPGQVLLRKIYRS